MKQVVDQLQKWNFRLCAVFMLDSQFLIETSKFFAGAMTALAAMVTLELPHVNVLSKMDLLDKKARIEVQKYVTSTSPFLAWGVCVYTLQYNRRQQTTSNGNNYYHAHGNGLLINVTVPRPIWWMGILSLAV